MPPTETHRATDRLDSIDAVRGLIMIIMALDHVRDFFSYTPFRADDVMQTSVPLFFTRWITHLCAPTFIFLSGVSIYLYYRKVNNLNKASIFLLSRGIWLIFLEIVLISFILIQGYQLTLLEVIWATGTSMILLAAFIWLPRSIQLTLALIMIVGHNALPMIDSVSSANMVLAFLHHFPFFINAPPVLVAYTIVPWVGVMLLGYALGPWFTLPPLVRKKFLLRSGISALILFVVLRFSNLYGDPFAWSVQERGDVFTVLSFLQITKSPPSFLFLGVTLGITFVLLVCAESFSDKVKSILITYGRVPLFYFVVHLAVISLSAYVWTTWEFGDAVNLSFTSPKEWPAAYRPNLLRAYVVWIVLVAALYFPCRWYGNFKAKNKGWWWSYL